MNGRLAMFAAWMILWSGILAARLVDVQVTRHDHYVQRAYRQQRQVIDVAPQRGSIRDARGRLLALSLVVDSAFADTFRTRDPAKTAGQLAPLLGADAALLARRLATEREFVWIARQLDPPIARRLRALELPGISFLAESRRYYPMNELAAPVLGFVGLDGQGLAGLESLYNHSLAGKAVRRTLLRDALRNRSLSPESLAVAPERGRDLLLTLDAALQLIAERELARASASAGAAAGSALLLDPRSGTVLALASSPGFDANSYGDYPQQRWAERNSALAADAGPLLATLAAIAAAEEPAARPGPGAPLSPPSPGGVNPGRLRALLRSLGFGSRTGIDLPGENPGVLPGALPSGPPANPAAASFIATPLQIASAFAAIVNGGRKVQPYVVAAREEERPLLERVVSKEASRALRLGLFAMEPAAAEPAGIPVAERSFGPAETDGGGTTWRHLGFVPAGEPAVLGLVTLDGVRGDGKTAAAAALDTLLQEAARYLRLSPGDPSPAVWPEQDLPAGGS